MAYDIDLADRLREILAGEPEVVEKRMFGGLSFMVDGQLCCGVLKDELVVRVGSDGFAEAVAEPHARPMDFTGKPAKNMVYVDAEGTASDEALAAWVEAGADYAASLPLKRK